MFKDLKEYAIGEETLKVEVHEHKSRRLELESMVEELREKNHNQEIKVRTQQVEIEKLRRENQLKWESQRFIE
jgi:hypothetical protein